MEHAPNLACAANGAKTNIALQSVIMETLNEEEQSLQQMTLNTQQNVFPTYASCETQTIVRNLSTNAMQTDLVVLQPSATQTDRLIQDSSSTQTYVANYEDRECQTNGPDVHSQEVQTEIKVVEEQITQTEKVTQIESESQTDLTSENITTVDKIELVQGMESCPMQTAVDKLHKMSPFKSDNENSDANMEGCEKNPEKDNISEVECKKSCISKSDDKVEVTVSAGLDMCVGKYKEFSYPPVSSASQKTTPVQPPVAERSPSPIDLCTKPSNDNKEQCEDT